MPNVAGDRAVDVPFAVTQPDRIPVERYFDPGFYELEKEHFWPRVWQMACRLEEIPSRGDYVVYRNLDKSVIVIRTDASTVKAYYNHCRHRGVELVQSQGKTLAGFICPFHGWRWNIDGDNTFVYSREAFSDANLCYADLNLVPVRVETWGGCAFINFDNDAPPLRQSLGSFATNMDSWKVDELRVEWWKAARLPVNWKLAMEAFMEGYHVATTHPQLLAPGVTSQPGDARWVKVPDDQVTASRWMTIGAKQMPNEMAAREFVELNIKFMDLVSKGMAGMTHQQEVEVARRLTSIELPSNPVEAAPIWRKALNQAVVDYYGELGVPVGDLNAVDALGHGVAVNFGFPHYWLLPTFGSASSYRIRPLGPEECLFELWSLTRYPKGKEPAPARAPQPLAFDDPSWPAIPKQDFANLPRQQRGLHSGMEYLRLSHEMEGMISNYHRLIDGYLGGASEQKIAAALQKVSGPIDVPVADLGLDAQ